MAWKRRRQAIPQEGKIPSVSIPRFVREPVLHSITESGGIRASGPVLIGTVVLSAVIDPQALFRPSLCSIHASGEFFF